MSEHFQKESLNKAQAVCIHTIHIVASDEAGTQNPEKNLKSFIQVLNDFRVSFVLVL